MRLIDADALDDVVQDLNENKNYGITRSEYKLIDAVLFEFPTIEERKKGKWIFIDEEVFRGHHICSQCKVKAEVDLYGEESLTNYCPNCGAEMDMRGDNNG